MIGSLPMGQGVVREITQSKFQVSCGGVSLIHSGEQTDTELA